MNNTLRCVSFIVLGILAGSEYVYSSSKVTYNRPDSSRFTTHGRADEKGIMRALYNVNSLSQPGTPEDVARLFLAKESRSLGLSDIPSTVRTERVNLVPGGFHVRFSQVYADIPVYRGDIIVSGNTQNHIGMVINNYRGGILLESTVPSIADIGAIEIVRQHLDVRGPVIGKEGDAELMIYPTERGTFHLSYRVSLTTEQPHGDWEVFVDANTGEILSLEDRFVLHRDGVRVQGSGMVYRSDPLSAARKMYNSPGFSDNNDADSDSLTAYRTVVTLDSVTFEDGMFKLNGPYCTVTDIESPPDPLFYGATSPDGFAFTRSQQEFEAVNVYYHVTQAYRRILDLGFSSLSLTQIRLDPHGFLGQDNSHYSPSGNWIAWGEGGVDDAEDADVIWHEYGHAIQYNFIPTWGGGECGALGEGFGDYWAGSYSRSLGEWTPGDYHYNWVFNWDGHNPFWLGRVLNDTRTYPFGILSIHSAGQIWSAALMGIWGDLGRDITDRLVLKSLLYLGSGTTGPDAAYALIQADRDLYGGAHLSTLVYWLGTVKRFINPDTFVPTIVHDPPTITPNPQGPFEIRALITSPAGLIPERAFVIWGYGSSLADTTEMVRTRTPDEYLALIPGSSSLDTLRYYIVSVDSNGGYATSPRNAPLAVHSFQVGSPTDANERELVVPGSFALAQNYPNPFNPVTSIRYTLPYSSRVTLRVFSSIGEEVARLVDDVHQAGSYMVRWNGMNNAGIPVASGVYFYRLEAYSNDETSAHVEMKRMILLR